jgi:hypothetical protein
LGAADAVDGPVGPEQDLVRDASLQECR